MELVYTLVQETLPCSSCVFLCHIVASHTFHQRSEQQEVRWRTLAFQPLLSPYLLISLSPCLQEEYQFGVIHYDTVPDWPSSTTTRSLIGRHPLRRWLDQSGTVSSVSERHGVRVIITRDTQYI